MRLQSSRVVIATLTSIALSLPSAVAAQSTSDDRLRLYGDMRSRVESDWDSRRTDGTLRDDRDRLRARLRVGFEYTPNPSLAFGGRLRTGARLSQQSPHITFGSDFQPKEINLDRLYMQANRGAFSIWGGKNSFPFWKQNELLWDDDVTPEGVAATYTAELDSVGSLGLRGGVFLVEDPVASERFSDQSYLLAGQVVFSPKLTGAGLDLALGFLDFGENPDQPNPALEDLDYGILTFSARASIRDLPKPLVLGFDWMKNLEDYPADLFNRDQTTGYVASAIYGDLDERGDWLAGYYYAHIERYAVVAFFAQDDWVRWGSTTQTRASNFEGHEVRGAYAFLSTFNLVARLYLVDGIARQTASATTTEDGKRFRVDLNIRF